VAEVRRPSPRLAVGIALALLGLLEAESLVQALRSQARFRNRALANLSDAVAAARPAVAEALKAGDYRAWYFAANEALRQTRASEAELFDPGGRRLLAYPAEAPVSHWPGPAEFEKLQTGAVVTVGPVPGQAARLLSYTSFSSARDTAVLLRVAAAAPDLVEEMREHRQLLLGHAAALVVLVLAGGLAFFPGRPAGTTSPRAFDAYEAAMERLRDQGREESARHHAERRRMAEIVQDREAMARAGELTAGIVHEVRNGLGTILGYARLIERSAGSPELAEASRSIREECETLETVVRRFMEFARAETLRPAPLELGRTLSRVIARESRARPGGQVAFDAEGVPTIEADEELLERAFENLIRNARDAAGGAGHVRVEARLEGGDVRITIADDGPGLSAEARARMRPFFSTKPGGLGLGIPIAMKIVALHQGQVVLAENHPRGLAVRVVLPRRPPAPPGLGEDDQPVTDGDA
jgi:signal transduction histidine kinase